MVCPGPTTQKQVVANERCIGKVYDMTDFLDEHPGGAEIILCATTTRRQVEDVSDAIVASTPGWTRRRSTM